MRMEHAYDSPPDGTCNSIMLTEISQYSGSCAMDPAEFSSPWDSADTNYVSQPSFCDTTFLDI